MTTKEQILAQAGEPTKFKRENKYLVLKLGDIAKFLTRDEQFKLDELIKKIRVGRLNDGKQDQSYVCVASDWPMYEQVWAAVQAFVEGKPSQIDELRQQLAEKDAEIKRLQHDKGIAFRSERYAKKRLALAQLHVKYYRELLVTAYSVIDDKDSHAYQVVCKSLAQPADTTALKELISEAGEVMRERCAKVCEDKHDKACYDQGNYPDGYELAEVIRALPGVKLEDLQG